jgi:nucleotide-binding universal stress UspA family protein
MKRILFPTDFSEAATNAFGHALAFAKKIQGELILLHSYPVLPIDEQFFPENFEMVYDTVELTEFDMFKEEVPKLHTIATACNLDNKK